MSIFIGIIVVVFIFFLGLVYIGKRKVVSKSIFDGYFASVTDAAAEGERAYRAQISTMGGSPTTRGVALARLATALFPIAAYAIAESSGAISPAVTRFSSNSGKEVWKLASGVALQPLGDIRGTSDFSAIKEDTHYSINQFVDLINSVNILSPSEAVDPALNHLSPIWHRAFEVSGVPKSDRIDGYARQYVTSGMHQLADVFGLLISSGH